KLAGPGIGRGGASGVGSRRAPRARREFLARTVSSPTARRASPGHRLIERKHRALSSIYLVNDAIASNLAMLCAFFLRFQLQVIPVTKGQQDFATYVKLLPIVTIVFPLAFAVQGLYRIRPTRSKTEEWLAVGVGSVVATIVLSGVLLWVRPGNPEVVYSRATLGIFMIGAIVFAIGGRALGRGGVAHRPRTGEELD